MTAADHSALQVLSQGHQARDSEIQMTFQQSDYQSAWRWYCYATTLHCLLHCKQLHSRLQHSHAV